MIGIRDVKLSDSQPKDLLLTKHEAYLKHYAEKESGTEQIMAEYLKMSGVYWGLNALYLMKSLDEETPEVSKTLQFIKECQLEDGGFAAAPNHDSHILHTLSAIQVLVILNKCNSDFVDVDRCVNYIKCLQQPDGSFFGDRWGEVDTRFSFCALATLKLLERLEDIDLVKAIDFVMSCNNEIDGGFGSRPGSESHSAYVYCCVGSLAIANKLDLVDINQLAWWLSARQLPSGGLNGRPQKLPDLCYSWWCLSSLKMINRMHLIDCTALLKFILACQDEEQGGFSDRPGNCVDPYHTMFGIASIALICDHFQSLQQAGGTELEQHAGENVEENFGSSNKIEFLTMLRNLKSQLREVDAILCMPTNRLKLIK